MPFSRQRQRTRVDRPEFRLRGARFKNEFGRYLTGRKGSARLETFCINIKPSRRRHRAPARSLDADIHACPSEFFQLEPTLLIRGNRFDRGKCEEWKLERIHEPIEHRSLNLEAFNRRTFVRQRHSMELDFSLHHLLSILEKFLRIEIRKGALVYGSCKPGNVTLGSRLFGHRHAPGQQAGANDQSQGLTEAH